jgi:16S rRNA (cytosine1407-C5)-methyltransferase
MKRKSADTSPLAALSPQAAALTRFAGLLPGPDYDRLMAELEKPLPPALRLNPLKATPEALASLAERCGWNLRPVPYCSTGWWIVESKIPLSQPIEHRMGCYYIQDAASMLPVELFDPCPDPDLVILDLAASPGGKTTHLISKNNDRGLVIANDSSADRITALRLVVQTWGAANVAVTQFAGEQFGNWFPETFDRVLIDAPCSMQNLRSTESHPMRPVSNKERQGLSHRQERLLAAALQAVRIGGQVVYSTCTLAPEEDEVVIDHILKLYGKSVRVEDASLRLPIAAPGLGNYGDVVFDSSVSRAARLWPHLYGTSGFFAALLRKQDSLPEIIRQPPNRPFATTGLVALNRRDNALLNERLLQVYGFDLANLMAQQGLSPWQRRGEIYLLPDIWLQRFAGFPYQMIGMILGKDIDGSIIPSHEFVARFGKQFKSGQVVLDEPQAALWLRGNDIPDRPSKAFENSLTVAVSGPFGEPLGRGKVLADRLKNLLPRRLVV